MTIPEAVSLIVQAGVDRPLAAQVFVLDMGEPVSIVDLARNMIRLSGKEPERDIAIEFVGVRPGEKLHEELWGDGESVGATPHPKILAVTRPPIDAAWLDDELAELERLVDEGETLELVSQARRDDEGAAACWRGCRRTPRRVTATPRQPTRFTRGRLLLLALLVFILGGIASRST